MGIFESNLLPSQERTKALFAERWFVITTKIDLIVGVPRLM